MDRSANPLSEGDIYVVVNGNTPAFNAVDVFNGAPAGVIGEEPEVVATLTGTCGTPETSCAGETVPFNEPLKVVVSPANGDVYVTDQLAGGVIVVDEFRPGPLHEYVFVGQLPDPPSGAFGEIRGVAVDGGSGTGQGEVYVADTSSSGGPAGGPSGVVYQFGVEGSFLGRLTGTAPSSPFSALVGVGVDGSSHDVFVAENDPEAPEGHRGRVDVFGPDLTIPDVETAPATGRVDREGHVSETLNGTVKADGAGEASCEFVWGTTQAFGNIAPCSENITGETTEPPIRPTAAIPVHALISGLAPDTTYWFRLHASNANGLNSGEAGQDMSFRTPGPGIHSVSSSNVTSSSVNLDAQVDPNGASTSVFFQYTTAASTAGCGAGAGACGIAPASGPEALGAGVGDVEVREHLQGLSADTTYHYRLVAVSELEVEPGVTAPVVFYSPDQGRHDSIRSQHRKRPAGRPAMGTSLPSRQARRRDLHPGRTGEFGCLHDGEPSQLSADAGHGRLSGRVRRSGTGVWRSGYRRWMVLAGHCACALAGNRQRRWGRPRIPCVFGRLVPKRRRTRRPVHLAQARSVPHGHRTYALRAS